MSTALDMLGAGEGLATQAIVLRVLSIDTDKLRRGLGDKPWGGTLAPAMKLVDQFPKAAIDMALPIAKQQLESLGITADLQATNVPPPVRPPAETKAALVVGTVLGIVLALGTRWAYARVKRKELPR